MGKTLIACALTLQGAAVDMSPIYFNVGLQLVGLAIALITTLGSFPSCKCDSDDETAHQVTMDKEHHLRGSYTPLLRPKKTKQ